jgi:hypothetical protein
METPLAGGGSSRWQGLLNWLALAALLALCLV